jgi:hypothetical protein
MDVIKGWWKHLQEKACKAEGTGLPLPFEVSSHIIQAFMVKKRMAEDK